jgi:hypothetical protein
VIGASHQRVPDAVQRPPGDAKHRPVALLRRAGTHMWTAPVPQEFFEV